MTSEDAQTAPRRQSVLGRLIGPLISIVCIAAVGFWIASQPAPEFPRGADALAMLAAAGLLTLIHAAVRGYRWKVILRAADVGGTGADPYLLSAVGYMGNAVLPARGGDIMRVGLLSRRRGLDWKAVTGTMVPERLLDLLSLALALIALSLSGAARSRLGAWPAILAIAGVVAIVAAIAIYHELRVRGHLSALADRVRPFTRATRVLLDRRGAQLMLLSVALWASEAVVLWLVVSTSLDPIPFFAAAFVVVFASLATAVPAAPGFIGTFDAAVIFGLQVAGVPPAETLALAVLYRLVLFVPTTLSGAVILVARYGGIRQLRRGRVRLAEEAA